MKYLVEFYLKRKFKEPVTIILNVIVCGLIIALCNIDLIFDINKSTINKIKLDATTSDLYPYLESDNFIYLISDSVNEDDEAILHYDENYQIICHEKMENEQIEKLENDLKQALRQKYRKEIDEKTNYYLDLFDEKIECNLIEAESNNDLIWIICSVVYFLIITYGSLIANDIVYEKNSRILELQFTCIDASEHFKAKILTGYLGLIIQFLIILVSLLVGISIRYRLDHFEGLINMAETSTQVYSFNWVNVIFSILIVLIGMILIQIILLIICSWCTNGEQTATVNSLFYIISLASYYYLLSNQSINVYIDNSILSYVPFISMYFEPVRLCLGIASMKEAILVLIINGIVLYLVIEVSLPIYKKNLIKR